jgi:hypothetical protein
LSILDYYHEYPKLSYDQVMTAYEAMLNRTGYNDPGNPSEKLRTSAEIAADIKRQNAVVKAYLSSMSNGIAQQVTAGALQRIGQYSGVLSEVVGPEAGETIDLANTMTQGLAKLLNLPADLSNEAVAERVAEATNAAEQSGGSMSGGDYDINDINSYLPDLSYIKRLITPAKMGGMMDTLINVAADRFGGTNNSGYLANYKTYLNFERSISYSTPDGIDLDLPPVADLEQAFGSNPDLIKALAARIVTFVTKLMNIPDFDGDRDAYENRLQQYHQISGGGLNRRRKAKK